MTSEIECSYIQSILSKLYMESCYQNRKVAYKGKIKGCYIHLLYNIFFCKRNILIFKSDWNYLKNIRDSYK